jgi:hypothetical protein
MKMSMEQWMNDTDKGKLKYWEENMYECHIVKDKPDMD